MKAKNLFSDFCVGIFGNDSGPVVHETLNFAKNEYKNWADFLNADSNVIVLWLDWYPTLWLLNAWGPLQLLIVEKVSWPLPLILVSHLTF